MRGIRRLSASPFPLGCHKRENEKKEKNSYPWFELLAQKMSQVIAVEPSSPLPVQNLYGEF